MQDPNKPSFLKDIYGTFKDKQEAEKIIEELNNPYIEIIKQCKEIFPHLNPTEIEEILKRNNYNLELAINELEENNKKHEEKEQAQMNKARNEILNKERKEKLEEFIENLNGIDSESKSTLKTTLISKRHAACSSK